MTFPPGSRVGNFEIVSLLGAGGMGEVYRARDAKLNRDVAIKVLPQLFTADPDRLARFRREAQVLASLNHPNIAHIYGVEDSGPTHALVLELVEGPTLADRIEQGAIPLDEALPIARQIADALECAHEQGVIHRDLKPANIKVRADGTVKVLDFGLAKALDPAQVGTNAALSPTITSPAMTRMGVILGTAAYMSPEQAKGRAADKRSDLWAFGCVLFEMLTGRRVFGGEEITDTLAFILTKEPDWTLLPWATPPSIRRLLLRCLEKDRRRRLADIADARLELEDAAAAPVAADSAVRSTTRGRVHSWVSWSLAVVSLVAAIWLGTIVGSDRPADEAPVYRSSILLPGRLVPGRPSIALSPDGRHLAFVAADATGNTQLWVRTLDSDAPRPLADTGNASSPFWSPDGRWVAFVVNGALKKIDVSGGAASTLCQGAYAGGTWGRNDMLLFTRSTDYSLAQVRATGGTASTVTTIDFKAGEWGHLWPSFLPDGRFMYSALSGAGSALGVYVAGLDSDRRIRLPLDDAVGAQYAAGFLWFEKGGTLMAKPFDATGRTVGGEAVPIAERLRSSYFASFFSVSPAGALAFESDPSPGYTLTWFNRAGRPTGTLGAPDDYADLGLSPDTKRAVVSVGEPGSSNRDLWIFDVARGVRTRFTSHPAPETHNAWSPGGERIVFDSRSAGHFAMFMKPSNGAGVPAPLDDDGLDKNPVAWSPDGRFIMYVKRSPGAHNLWVLPLDGDRKPFAFTDTAANVPGQFSPDGRWVVYGSRDSGRMEVYVAPFPGPGAKTLVSTDGGFDPRWRGHGKEILYLANRKLMSAAVTIDRDRVRVGDVKPLFDLPKIGPRYSYDISPDGQRILAVTRKDDAGSTPLTLVVNWPALLNK